MGSLPYQGDEYAEVGGNDPDNRHMMRFDGLSEDQQAFRDKVRHYIALRRTNMALNYGDYIPVVVKPDTEYQRATGELSAEATMDFEIMLRDYDYVNTLQPDFSFAYFNKANMLCAQKEYTAAIAHYSKAIACDNDFAEAYFNRGLTRIYIDQIEEGIADLSKAGELGIYQAYNLITRFK